MIPAPAPAQIHAELAALASQPRVPGRPMTGASMAKNFDSAAYIRQHGEPL